MISKKSRWRAPPPMIMTYHMSIIIFAVIVGCIAAEAAYYSTVY